MIFVTVGTTHGFDRLIAAVDKAMDTRVIQDEVVAQIGNGTYEPRNFQYVRTLEKTVFDGHIRRSAAMISHAGMGVLTTAFEHGKRILVMPRRRQYREAVNDHQVPLAEELARLGHLLLARNEKDLLDQVGKLDEFVPVPRRVDPDAVINRIDQFLKSSYSVAGRV